MAFKGAQNPRDMQHPIKLRLVLLGGQNSGKSFVGNSILNREEFVLRERTTCMKRKAEFQGRRLTVVDTPGWWCDFSAQDTPELVRREIRRSVFLSLPGPNAFLLVVKIDSAFIEKRRRAVEEHLELLGKTIWSHTLVLFTKGKHSGDTSFEEHVKASGKPLQWLLKKCSGRFHVLDIQGTCNATQIKEMMVKIDKMVAGNPHFEMDHKTLQEIEDKRREVELKAHQRLIRIHKQRATLKVHSYHLQSFRLVLLGAKGSGKSSTGKSILAAGSDQRFTAKRRTTRSMMETCIVAGRHVTVVDTPGWWMNYFAQDSSAFDKQEIVNSIYLCPPGPHAFLLVVRVDRSFTETYRRAIQEHVELISKEIWNHTIVVFSFGDWLGDTTIDQHIESEGKALQWLVERCGDRYHVLNNKSLGNMFQITALLEKIEEMRTGNGVSHINIDKSVFKDIERKQREEENRVKLRWDNVLRRRYNLRAFKEQVQLPTSIRVILLGGKNSGKTSAARCILGNDGLETDSQKPMRGTVIFNEKNVEVMDTTGWTTECPDTTEFSRQHLKDWVSGSASGICTLLLVVNGSSSFTLKNLRAADEHLRALGGNAWSCTIVLFTNGDWLGEVSVEQYIEREEALQMLMEKCENRYHVFNNKIKDNGTQVAELMQKIEEMVLEQMLNSTENQENIKRPLVNGELQLDGSIQIGEEQITPLSSSTNIHHGDTDVPGEHQMIGFSGHPLPSSSCDLRITNTDSSLSRSENQELTYRNVRLSRNSLLRNNQQSLVVVLNTSEWFHPNEPWGTDVNRTSRPELPPLAVLNFTPAEQPRNELRMLRNRSQEGRFCEQSFPQYQTRTPYTGQTAKEKAFVDFVQSGSLQDLIDQWGDSNIEELEAFIDSYFEMVWQEAMKEAKAKKCSNAIPINCECSEKNQEHLASIDRKLSKLDILGEVQRDLLELKQSFKHCSRIFQELKDRSKETNDPCRHTEATGSAVSEERD
ncbi:GTPase IMAP family member 8 [Myxocyprinus asiaticus]|uniref:GTPase IMAP family member 8 n=1 Tax=Myxocyprinus asiaticus TaxID=70543 RepID=UPI002223CC7E|nr:GTPase IMAP family member 8 [Myxocyprinus asiaticus]